MGKEKTVREERGINGGKKIRSQGEKQMRQKWG